MREIPIENTAPAIGVTQGRPAVLGKRWMVSSSHYLASQAGAKIFERGGNAIDAGVAAGTALNVLERHLTDFGGVAPIVLFRPGMDGPESIDGLGRWPASYTLDEYRLDPTRRPPTQIPVPPASADDLIDEGPLRYVADIELVAMHTPGHTEGSTCFYLASEKALFSGDVLFKGNVGRVDLPGGDAQAMEHSLARVAALPPETRVYPGHGDTTTIGAELPWLRGFRFS